MTTQELKMISDIESMNGRSTRKECLEYDKATLQSIIAQGYVTVIGNIVSREFHRRLQS